MGHKIQTCRRGDLQLGRVRVSRPDVLVLDVIPAPVDVEPVGGLISAVYGRHRVLEQYIVGNVALGGGGCCGSPSGGRLEQSHQRLPTASNAISSVGWMNRPRRQKSSQAREGIERENPYWYSTGGSVFSAPWWTSSSHAVLGCWIKLWHRVHDLGLTHHDGLSGPRRVGETKAFSFISISFPVYSPWE